VLEPTGAASDAGDDHAPPASAGLPQERLVSDVPTPGPAGRLPRHVAVLLLVLVAVVGFAIGGSLRSALASAPAPALPGSGPGTAPTATLAGRTESVASVTVARAPRLLGAPGARAGVAAYASHPARLAVGSPSRRGKALPAHSGTGRRIVYQESTMHLWVVDTDGTVLRDYPVTGRPDWPRPGVYSVFAKVPVAASPKYHVTFDWMVRFAHGNQLNIGFHDIPRFMGSGIKIQAEDDLGAPIGHGGCVRQRTVDAKWLYAWATIGTKVTVLR
jgi:hypothetical protein